VHVDPKSRKGGEQSPQNQRDSLSSQSPEGISLDLSPPVGESPLQMHQQIDTVTVPPNQRRENTSDWQEARQPFASNIQMEPITHENETTSESLIRPTSNYREDIEFESASLIPPHRKPYPFGPLKGLPENFSHYSYTTLQEACLIRHFTEYLSSWVSVDNLNTHVLSYECPANMKDMSSLIRVIAIDTSN